MPPQFTPLGGENVHGLACGDPCWYLGLNGLKEKAEVLELLAHAAARGGVAARALFHGIAANEACASYFTEQFAQKVGLEQAGRCYDLYANSYLADPAEIEKAAREAEPIAFGASEKKAMVRRKGSK